MENDNFKLEFTASFWRTFDESLEYIDKKTNSSGPRDALFAETLNAINKRLPFADSFSSIEVKSNSKTYKVYHIKVNSFYIFYQIKRKGKMKIMEIQRFAYGRMNLNGFLY